MSTSMSTSNVTAGFIDLATYDELEKYMYGGADATAYFVRETRKATWFTQVPVVLSRASGSPQFGSEWSVTISRAGDYLLQTWLRVTLPKVNVTDGGHTLRWTKNLMHNLIRECAISFNDLVAARFDNYHLDFWTAFTVPSGKRNGYNNMIGNFDELVTPQSTELASHTLNLPLPLFYSRDSGVALPTAALPYNDMRIQFSFRQLSELLIKDDLSASGDPSGLATETTDYTLTGSLKADVWANYAIVSNDERKRMACAPRDILIEQVQTAHRHDLTGPGSESNIDIRLSHAIKVLFFGARNTTVASQWSNYTAASPVPSATSVDFTPSGSFDPIETTSLVYENTTRLSEMGSDYFSLVQPFYGAPVVPLETGYHMYSYSLDFISLDPMGSTNYGKLTNVSLRPKLSANAGSGAATDAATGNPVEQKFQFIVTAVNNNIIRVSGGALGFPVL